MATGMRRTSNGLDHIKYAFFAVIGLCVLLVLWTDERFWINPSDPHWKHVAQVKWLLVFHGLGGATALSTGAFQMSSRIRRLRPRLHHALGRTYLVAVCVSAPVAIYMGTSSLEPASIHVEQIFQGGLWLLSALVAWACILNGQMALHKAWMMRSYAFTLIFVVSRVPDAFISSYSDQFLSDMLWSLVVAGLIAPEAILTGHTLLRIRAAKARSVKPSSSSATEEPLAI